MILLLRAEWRKLFTTRLWWGMLIGAIALTLLGVLIHLATNGLPHNPTPPLSAAGTQRSILATASGSYIFSLVVGIIFMTTEFRHFTSRPTFLIEPHRGRVILAKLFMGAALGILYGIVCIIAAVVLMIPWYAHDGVSLGWVSNSLYAVMLADLAVVAIYAIVGVGVGVLIRNQITAVIAALVFLFVIETLIDGLANLWTWVADTAQFLPGDAANAVTQAGSTSARGVVSTVPQLTPIGGGFVLAGWGLLFAILGWVVLQRRDIA